MRTHSRWAPVSDINVTPMVDVMLVLLVIFMVSAPFMDQGISVALPRAATGQEVGGSSDLEIVLTKEHVIYVDKEVLTLEELRGRLHDTDRARPVLIRADERAYVSRLVELWDACREFGFREIHIATTTE